MLWTAVAAWSALNAVWVEQMGVQLQPAVLSILLRAPRETGPVLASHLAAQPLWVAVGLLLGGVATVLIAWVLWRPGRVSANRSRHACAAVAAAAMVGVLGVARWAMGGVGVPGLTVEAMDYSSHWEALTWVFRSIGGGGSEADSSRTDYAVAGQREVLTQEGGELERPNLVMVLLESVSWRASSLGDPNADATPYLARLAGDGVSFDTTRVVVSHTSKALWAVLTSSTPVIRSDFVEAAPADRPYESLATILGRFGYRSGFFKMAKGSFECAPGLCCNLGYDWAWFRENLEDTSAYLGYLAGDDCRLIEPALAWAQEGSGPFLLTVLTSVCHDPFEVPAAPVMSPASQLCDRYRQAVRYTDSFLEQFCDCLASRGLDENTIVCVLGDHGTSFRSTAGRGRWFPYEETIRVPWVIRWPGHIKAGQRVRSACSHLDVTPTLLSLMGYDVARAGFEGIDALGQAGGERRHYFSSWYEGSPSGFVEGRRKVVYWPGVDKGFEYDLRADPDEERPGRVGPAETKAIRDAILAWTRRYEIQVDVDRFRSRLLYDHWETFSQGRRAWAYYRSGEGPARR